MALVGSTGSGLTEKPTWDDQVAAAVAAAEAVARQSVQPDTGRHQREDTVPPPVAEQLPIRIHSAPPNARISEGNTYLGTTPLLVMIGWDESRVFTCSMPKHLAKRFTLRATDGPAVKVTLRAAEPK